MKLPDVFSESVVIISAMPIKSFLMHELKHSVKKLNVAIASVYWDYSLSNKIFLLLIINIKKRSLKDLLRLNALEK